MYNCLITLSLLIGGLGLVDRFIPDFSILEVLFDLPEVDPGFIACAPILASYFSSSNSSFFK